MFGFGRRKMRDDTNDWYDFRPMGEAVAWIRETLSIDPPMRDPFPPPPDKAEAAPIQPAPVKHRAPAHAVFGADNAGDMLPAAIVEANATPWRDLPPRGPP
jgi:hypothetical protein